MRYNRSMRRTSTNSGRSDAQSALPLLTILAFLSPGAWLIVSLPPQPVAQFLHLATASVWLAFFAWRGRECRIGRPVLIGVAVVVCVTALSLATNVYPAQQLLYDLYGEMPGLIWLVYPAVFLVAASVRFGRSMRNVLAPTVIAGMVLIAVMALWRWNVGFVTTFGSPAYSIPALAPIPFLSLGLARTAEAGRSRGWFAVAAASAAGLAYAGGGLSAFFMLGLGALALLAVAPALLGIAGGAIPLVRRAAAALLLIACLGVAIVQFPALSARVFDTDRIAQTEQTVATRLYLWQGASRMVAERPWLGFGPAGYRFFAVEEYDPRVFGYIAGAGSDPTAYSAPSPHSLVWEALTRLGVIGLLALVGLLGAWGAEVKAAAEKESETRALRLSLAVAFVAYLASLLVTPVHFASGLLGAVVGGFAIARSDGPVAPRAGATPAAPGLLRVAAATVAAIVLAYGAWRMAGLTAGSIEGAGDLAADRARVESAARIVPGEPLNERRRLDIALLTATGPDELAAARAAVDASPGYIRDYPPNLVQFAAFGMMSAEAMGQTGFGWERALLEQVEDRVPGLPSLAGERLHLALVEGDAEALPALIDCARTQGATYPLSAGYIARAEEELAR